MDINEENNCAAESWMEENFHDRVREWSLLETGNLRVKNMMMKELMIMTKQNQ